MFVGRRSISTCPGSFPPENGSILLLPGSISEEIDRVCEIRVPVREPVGPFLAGNESFVAGGASRQRKTERRVPSTFARTRASSSSPTLKEREARDLATRFGVDREDH
jgi:hypothetical protein